MKGNAKDTVELSLLGVAKALAQDVDIDLSASTNVEEVLPQGRCRVVLPDKVTLVTRESSREKTYQDNALPPEKFNSQGRVITGRMPVLFPIGFQKLDDGEIILTEGNHCMIAGNFTSVFGGTNCAECAAAFDKAVADGKTVWMTPTFSQNGKWWMNFSAE